MTEALIAPPARPLANQIIGSSLGGSVVDGRCSRPPHQLCAVKVHQKVSHAALKREGEAPPAWATWCTHPVIFYPGLLSTRSASNIKRQPLKLGAKGLCTQWRQHVATRAQTAGENQLNNWDEGAASSRDGTLSFFFFFSLFVLMFKF